MTDDKLAREYGEARMKVHNAKQTLDALEAKARKRAKRIKAHEADLAKLESSLGALVGKIERAKAAWVLATEAYRPLRTAWKERQERWKQRRHDRHGT
jgi:hypothetical protein